MARAITLSNKIAQVRRRRNMPIPSRRKSAPFMWPDYRAGRPEWHIVDYESYVNEGFNLNTLVYASIMYKVRALSQVPLRAYEGDIDHPEQLDADHPLSKLCARPNPHQSFIEFQSQNAVYLNLAGNCYIFMDRSGRGGIPEAMYSLRPDRVFIIPGKSRAGRGSGLMGYLYVPEGRSRWSGWTGRRRQRALRDGGAFPIAPENMMHVKLPNPGDPLEGMGYGLSPLSPAARSVDVDNKVTNFLKLFFDHGTMFQGVLSFDVPLSEEIIPLIRDRWADRYGGYQNWADIGILDQGGKYQRLSPTFDEMGFEEIDSRNETRVLRPFGVPPILIGTRIGLARSTYSNFEEARRMCWQDTLLPESRLYEVEYKYYLSGERGEFVAYDYSKVPALKEDIGKLVDAFTKLVSSGVPKDDAAQVVGLPIPQLEDGQVIYMPVNLIPVNAEPAVTPLPSAFPVEETPAQLPQRTEPERTEEGAANAEDDEERAEGKQGFPFGLRKNLHVGG
jgi:phage portal protein BeeE